MLLILLKSSACLAVFMLFYKLCLEKTSVHIFKRFYLIGVILISLAIPFITLTEYIVVKPVSFIPNSEFTNQPLVHSQEIIQPKNYLPTILWSIYGIGVLIFAIRFFKNLYKLIQKIKTNPKIKKGNFINVLLQDLVLPHTFFKYIFLNKTKYEKHEIPDEVLLHEQTHAKQKHALDILFIEVLQILFWFNPLLFFIKKDIKLNHEFLADQAVLKSGTDTKNYQQILLAFSSSASHLPLANAINYLLIKKRFTVMKTQTSRSVILIRNLFLLPILAILIFAFSDKVYAEKTKTSEKTSLESKKFNEGATESMMKEYNNFIAEYEATKRIYRDKLRRAAAIYDIMTDKQRASVRKYPETSLNRSYSEKELKHPTQAELDSWSQSTDLTISIDAMRIKNTELNKYKPKDFVIYRLSRKPQAYNDKKSKPTRCFLYTDEGFKRIILKHNFNDYHRLFVRYTNEIDAFVNSKSSDSSELLILKVQLDNLYANFSEEEISEYHPRIAPEIPSKNKIVKNIKVSKKVTEYNVLAKKYNNPDPKGQRYPREEIDQLYELYNNLTDAEKAIAQVFPNLPYPIQKKYEKRK